MTNSSSPAAPLDVNGKGLGAFPESCTTADVAALNWNLLNEDVSLPVAVLYEARMRHNLQWMQQFMEAYHGFSPWDAMADPDYFTKLLIKCNRPPSAYVVGA